MAYFAANQTYAWTLNTWTDNYTQRVASTAVESGVVKAAQRILADESTSDVKFVRLTFGTSMSYITIALILPSLQLTLSRYSDRETLDQRQRHQRPI